MSWWWPFGSRSGTLRKIAPHDTTHTRLASQFFWMPKRQQLQVLYYLGVPFTQQSVVHASMRPFKDVEADMDIYEPDRPLTAEMFMDKLKALELLNREIVIIGVLQNIFESLSEAKSYLPGVSKWPAILKQ